MRIEEVFIPMKDGVMLAADLYRPDEPCDKPSPVLLEYLPYRKTESRGRNTGIYTWFVDHGYIVARVDIRGTGNSQGRVIPYEYSEIELADGEVVIDWLASQPWSTGNIGMFGISWGGFNSIQMAARNPPALKAFIAVMATEDLYREDTHYLDGIIVTDSWLMSHDLYNAMPGAPDFLLDEEWLENRFNAKPSMFTYVHEQSDGPFWDRASSLDKYDQIKVPGFHIGGWYDGYRNSLPRMVERVSAPVKAMIGPWDHYLPHNAWPGPQVEWRHDAVRWFDHWLKGEDTGIMDEPAFAVYMRDYHPPEPELTEVSGDWFWINEWPPAETVQQAWYAHADHGLSRAESEIAVHQHDYQPSQGLEGGGPTMWWGSIPPDQQPNDDHCLVYESDPLEETMEIAGFPVASLPVSSTARHANWVVRLSDVAPDGQVTQVVGAACNGTQRQSPRNPEYLVPDEEYEIEIPLHFTSWRFPAGHRVRIAISNSQWPMLWPSPELMRTTLAVGGASGARICFPVIESRDFPVPDFPEPDGLAPRLAGYKTLDSGNVTGYAGITRIEQDPDTGEALGVASNSTAQQYPWGIERFDERIEHRTSDSNPALTSSLGIYAIEQQLKDRTLRFEQEVLFSSDRENFHLRIDRRLLVNDQLKHQNAWSESIPRKFQ